MFLCFPRELSDVTGRYRESLDRITMFEGELRAWASKSSGVTSSESSSHKVLQALITSQQETSQRCRDLQDAIRHMEKDMASSQGAVDAIKVR